MKNRIVVTGGAGFIGCNLVAALNSRGIDDIVIVDRLGCGEKWRNLAHLRFDDFIDKSDFRELVMSDGIDGIDAVVHLGACSSTTEKDADYLLDNNYHYTRDLCLWCMTKSVRFIYASSAATYGAGECGYSDSDANTLNLKPLNMYGYSKHMFDLWAHKNGLLNAIAGIKYFNVYGPHEEHKGDMRSVVYKAFRQIEETGSVKLFKSYRDDYRDGEQVRDFVYVKDAVDVTLYFYDNPGVSGLFNCGSGTARTWVDLAKAVFHSMDREPNIEFTDMPPELRGKYQYHTEAETMKLRAAGYSSDFTTIEQGIEDYVRRYLNGVLPKSLDNTQ